MKPFLLACFGCGANVGVQTTPEEALHGAPILEEHVTAWHASPGVPTCSGMPTCTTDVVVTLPSVDEDSIESPRLDFMTFYDAAERYVRIEAERRLSREITDDESRRRIDASSVRLRPRRPVDRQRSISMEQMRPPLARNISMKRETVVHSISDALPTSPGTRNGDAHSGVSGRRLLTLSTLSGLPRQQQQRQQQQQAGEDGYMRRGRSFSLCLSRGPVPLAQPTYATRKSETLPPLRMSMTNMHSSSLPPPKPRLSEGSAPLDPEMERALEMWACAHTMQQRGAAQQPRDGVRRETLLGLIARGRKQGNLCELLFVLAPAALENARRSVDRGAGRGRRSFDHGRGRVRGRHSFDYGRPRPTTAECDHGSRLPMRAAMDHGGQLAEPSRALRALTAAAAHTTSGAANVPPGPASSPGNASLD
ncbi:hypothetical protein FOA52_000404 [Chlamydomonas sp. UWO 241]|nr:hypothetical protein FOA52_000404 [Chlamydomonas sp. UWO 241]